MGDNSFTQQVEAARQHLEMLQQQANHSPVSPQNLLAEALAELAVAVEKLEAAAEKLRQQDEALAATHQAIEVERQRYQVLLHKGQQAEEALRQSDTRNRALLNAIPDMMFQISRDGIYLDYKPAKTSDLFGPATEFLGKKVFDVLPPELAQQILHAVEQALQSGETQIYEYQLPINGKIRTYEARISASGENEALAIVRDITERKAREALLKEERARIARDLHDSLAQNLYFLGLKLDYLCKQVAFAPANVIIDELSTLKKTVQANIDDVRRTVFVLRPVELETLGFGPALRQYIREFGEQVGLEIILKVQGDEAALPTTLELVLFLLAQEGLANIARHAQARHVWLELTIHPGRIVRLTIQDDGIGFDPQIQPALNSYKMGLRQMREQVAKLEGQFKIESAPAQGVTLRLEIPLSGRLL